MESGDPFDPRAPRSPRREQRDTERLDSGNHAEPVNPAWRRTRSAGVNRAAVHRFPRNCRSGFSTLVGSSSWLLSQLCLLGLCSSFSVNRMHRGRCPLRRPNRSRRLC